MNYLNLFLFLGILIIMLSGCKDSGVNTPPETPSFLLEGNASLPNQNSISWWNIEGKAKVAAPSLANLNSQQVQTLYKILDTYSQKKDTPYVAFISSKKKNKSGQKDKKFKYRYFKLKPNKEAIEQSGGERTFYFHIYVDPANHDIYQILAVLVPKTEEQIEIVKEWGDKLNSTISVRSDSSRSRNKSLVCTYEEGLVWEPLCGCFSIGTIEVCPPSDDKQLDPGDDGGSTTDCHYEPEGCQEDPNPNDPPFGGGGSNGGDTNEPDHCPIGQVEDANGNCIMGEVPCEGNPLKSPRIAEQKQNSGINGGRFTVGDNAVRDGGNRDHKGLDLLVGHGEALFTMKQGVVKAIESSEKLGKYVIVSYNIGGEDVWILYAHLNTVNISYGTFPQGTVIGTAGISGNLAGAIKDNYAYQHVHVEARIGGWSGKNPKNPENYLSTKFNSDGTIVSGTDC